jgi:hypothetical protein
MATRATPGTSGRRLVSAAGPADFFPAALANASSILLIIIPLWGETVENAILAITIERSPEIVFQKILKC